MFKRLSIAAAMGVAFALSAHAQTIGSPGTGGSDDRTLPGARPMVGAGPLTDRDGTRRGFAAGDRTTGTGGSLSAEGNAGGGVVITPPVGSAGTSTGVTAGGGTGITISPGGGTGMGITAGGGTGMTVSPGGGTGMGTAAGGGTGMNAAPGGGTGFGAAAGGGTGAGAAGGGAAGGGGR